MSIKTLLLHMAHDDDHELRLRVGVELANRFEAYLEVLYIATPVSMPAAISGRGASYAYLAEATAIAREKAAEVEHQVRHACSGVSYSWSVVEGDHAPLLAARAAYCDLTIVSQSRPAHLDDRVLLHVPEELVLASACPALVLPRGNGDRHHVASVGLPPSEVLPVLARHVLVAWKACREASRAVREALPFLRRADKVTVLTVDPPGHRQDTARDLMVFLERQGIATQHHSNINDSDENGADILTVAEDLACDGIVMGAYGHSRLRELVLGGTTRHILNHMTLPILMAH